MRGPTASRKEGCRLCLPFALPSSARSGRSSWPGPGDKPVRAMAVHFGISESSMRNWMAQADADDGGPRHAARPVVIATEFGWRIQGGTSVGLDSRPEQIKRVADASLRRLQVDTLDLHTSTASTPTCRSRTSANS